MAVPTRQARDLLQPRPVIAEQVFPLPHCTTMHERTTHPPVRWRPRLRTTLIVLVIVGALADVAGVMYLDSRQAALSQRLDVITDLTASGD